MSNKKKNPLVRSDIAYTASTKNATTAIVSRKAIKIDALETEKTAYMAVEQEAAKEKSLDAAISMQKAKIGKLKSDLADLKRKLRDGSTNIKELASYFSEGGFSDKDNSPGDYAKEGIEIFNALIKPAQILGAKTKELEAEKNTLKILEINKRNATMSKYNAEDTVTEAQYEISHQTWMCGFIALGSFLNTLGYILSNKPNAKVKTYKIPAPHYMGKWKRIKMKNIPE